MRETVSSLVRYGGFGLGRFTVIWLISPPFQCSTRRAVWLAASAVMTTSSSRVCRSSLRSRSGVDGAVAALGPGRGVAGLLGLAAPLIERGVVPGFDLVCGVERGLQRQRGKNLQDMPGDGRVDPQAALD